MSKYKAKKNEYEGITFDSKKEMKRYIELKGLEEKGEINDLRLQVKHVLIPSQREDGRVIERECSYIADFEYEKDGQLIVEDVKGYRKGQAYALYTVKRKLMLYNYGIRIKEI